jgi:hypothetical protein
MKPPPKVFFNHNGNTVLDCSPEVFYRLGNEKRVPARVQFEVTKGPKGWQAENVQAV